jgi:hypothetical protein
VDTRVIAEAGREPMAPATRSSLPGLAGPALIVIAVLVVLNGFLRGLVTTGDVIRFWLPVYCHLGKSLAAGHIPAWNPAVMGGVPFAADPQSGWMYAPVMALFTALPCDVAIRAMVVLQPILAGLGIYWFTRIEGLSRPAATVGGLALAMALASTRLSLFLPFPASLAWTALLLAAAARYLRTRTWPARLLWAGLTAAAWGQLAAAHAGHGLIMGTVALAAYVAAKWAWQARQRDGELRNVGMLVALLLPVTAVVNLAYLVPRLAYLPRTSYQVSYASLAQLNGRDLGWPLHLSASPGMYLGAVVLGLAFASWWSSRHRALAVAFTAFGSASYVLSLKLVADHLAPSLKGVPVLDFYRHYPGRFVLGVVLVIPILGAIGLEAFREARSGRDRLVRAAPGLAVWFALPVAAGLSAGHRWVLYGAGAGAALALMASVRRPALILMVPLLVAVELTGNALLGQASPATEGGIGADLLTWFEPLRTPSVDPGPYLRPSPFAVTIQHRPGARYLSLDPAAASPRGYLTHQGQGFWGFLANQRSMLLHLEDAQGYNPFQLERYWAFVRQVSPIPLDYNAAVFADPPPVALDLLDVGWVIGPEGVIPPGQGEAVGADPPWVLYRLGRSPPRAEVVSRWRVVPDEGRALYEVTAPGFDPSREVLLERDPGLGSPPAGGVTGGGSAEFRGLGDQRASIVVEASAPSVVLVRNVFDRNWHATVDGRPAPVLAADELIQAVPVAAGRHTVELSYDDPSIGYGLLGSCLGVAILFLAVLVLHRSKRVLDSPRAF